MELGWLRKTCSLIIVASFIISSFNFIALNSTGDIAATISTVSGTNVDDKFGWNVSDCKDVNGDGIDDVIVGAPGYNGNQGRAYIFFGGSGFVGDLASDSADVILDGSWAGAEFGWDVSGVGDFNGDGFNDTIVGAPGNNSNTGTAYIFYGSSSLGGSITSNNANITIDGENPDDFFGSSVSDAGDMSKEITVDYVVISEVYANAVDETSPDIGEFMELYNPTSSAVLLDNWVIEDLDAHSFTIMGTIPAYGFFLIAIDNYLGSTDPTEASWLAPDFDCGYTSGSVFANSGDEIRLKDDTGAIIDTFGYGNAAEWFEGAYYPALPNQGEGYERKLGETMPNGGNAIDTNDNANDFAIRSAAEPQNTISATEVPPSQSFYNDVIVGAYGYGNGKGRAYVFYGSSGVANIASDADVILEGESDNDLFGFSVSASGDVNSDSFDDIIVGAPGFDTNRGKSYLFFGAVKLGGLSQDIKFAHWDESDSAVADNVYPIQNNQMLGQSFTPDKNYLITKVSIYIEGGSTTPSRAITVELQGDAGGLGPDGVTLATSWDYNRVLSQATWVEFEFTVPFQATSGTEYWIVAMSGTNPGNQWLWTEDETGGTDYPGGNGAYYGGGTWTEDPPESDYWFKVYGKLPANPIANVTMFGETQNDLFGWSVSSANDIGGDGFDDVIIGAPGTANGNAYVVNGSAGMQDVTVAGVGWGDNEQIANWESSGDFEPAVYTGQFLAQSFIPTESLELTKVELYIETFGTPGTLTITLQGSTGVAPDTVPDGVVLAQAPAISTGNVSYEWTEFIWNTPYVGSAGTEYFIVGEGTGASTGNCWGWYTQNTGTYPTGDSAFDQGSGWNAYTTDSYFRAYGKPASVPPNITFQGESPGDMFGYSVSGAGNFNGDMNDDIVVGAPYNGNGMVYIFNGSNNLPSLIQAVNANYTALGEGPMDRFGWSVSMARDVNTTVGNFEVIVGAPYQDPGGLGDAGKAYILSQASVPPPPPLGDLPFRINNDGEFASMAVSEGWVGDGSSGNPYIIENYDIDGGGYGYCAYIGNTTVSFIIRDSNFYNSSGNPGNYFWDSGVALYNAPNGSLINNTFENCTGNAVHIVGTTNTTISQNTILNSTGSGVYLESSTGNFIDDNTFDNNNYGLEMNTNSDSNTITNNRFTNNSEAMDLWASDNNIISNNYGDQNGIFAYLFSSCNGNEFMNNTISNSGTGIYLQSNCDGNTIQNNTISDITWEGILIESSDSNIIEANNIQRTRYGLYTLLGVLNIISNNTFSNNTDYGIYLDPGSDQNTISNNTIADNGEFGILMISADFNIIIYNDIINNTLYGINTTSTTNENEIHHNNFTNNNGGDVQAYDDGTDNWWNDTAGEGNLWGDYENRYVPPATSNGIVWDIPYDINGSSGAQDLFPLALYPWQMDLRIDNNTDFADTAAFFGWAGDGSAGNPYVIEGLAIDAGSIGYGIYIGNTTANFIIRNCTIENSTGNSDQYFRNSGIYLFNATNGTLENNNISSCDRNGINIEYSLDIIVHDNTVNKNNWNGIYAGYYSNITISDNTCNFNNWSGVWLWSTSDSFVINNTLLNNTEAITLEWSNNNVIEDNIAVNNSIGMTMQSSDLNDITNNTFNDSKFEGIYMDLSDYNTITDNTCEGNYDGIYLSNSHNNTISSNVFSNNTAGGFSGMGMFLDYSNDNQIFDNNVSGNKEDGIYVFYSDNNTISNNTCWNNPEDGISVYKSNNNTLSNNTLIANLFGLFFENRCLDNMIEGNNISQNLKSGIYFLIVNINNTVRNNIISQNADDGIYANDRNSKIIIENNTISENGKNGINLTYDSDDFVIIYNIIANNSEYAIRILDNDCENSLIHHNGFYNNNGSGVQAYDNGSNSWDDGYPSGGNFWSDYIGVDFNSTAAQDVPPPDGFGDTPYDTNGPKGAQDRYPLITFPWSPPLPIGLPEITDVSALPDPQETGGSVNISCNVTDSDGVSEVWLNITLPSGGTINTSMKKGTGNLWFDNSIYSLLGNHDYVIWAKDAAGVWNSSSGHTFIIQDTTPPLIFNVQNLPNPQESGSSVNISCDVIDNVGVFGVWVNISLPTGGFSNVSMTKGAGDEWFYESVYVLLGGYSYTIWANDTSDNWGNSMNNNFLIQDTTLPVISNVFDSPDPQEVGGSVNISCDVTDNVGVFGVWVNISLPTGGFTNVSMTKGAGDEWFYESVYVLLGGYSYTIWANDTSDNWGNSMNNNFQIQDTTLPVISNVLDSPDPQLTGGNVNITCDVTDNLAVNGAWINITLPSGGNINVSMTKGVGDEWYNDTIYVPLGIYNYIIWANDTQNNWASASGFSFTIYDANLPLISNVLDNPDPQETGGFVNISCDVTDDISVVSVWVNITLASGGYSNVSMIKGLGDEWFWESSYIVLGTYDYVIWANDTSNNWVSSIGHSFMIQDTTLPEIFNVLDVPDPQEVGSPINISCDVLDNIGVFGVWINITLPGGGFTNVSMTKGMGSQWFLDSVFLPLGVYNYAIFANDTSDNWNLSSGYTFTIQDTTQPVISNVIDVPDPQEIGGLVNISCDATDFVGVYNVWINITQPGGGYNNISMIKGVGSQWFYTSPYLILGIHDYVIWANDSSNNWVSSSGYSFLIRDMTPPEISSVIALPNIQITQNSVNISCDATDFVGVYDVWINITNPLGSSINISMEKGPGNSWYNNTIYSMLGIYDYVIWVNDTSDNWNSSSGHTFEIQTGPAYNIILISGDGQNGIVGTQLSAAFIVEVQDQFGNSIPVASVWFNITSGGGNLNVINPVITDVNGRAQAYLTLGTISGANTVSAEIAGLGISQVTFSATGLSGGPFNIVVVSGNGQSGEVNTQLPAPLIVEVTDQFGNTVSNCDVWFNVTLGNGITSPSNPIITDASGRAQTYLSLGTSAGLNTVNAEISSSGIDQVSFTAIGNAGDPYDIVIISGNGQSDVVGAELPGSFVVQVTDQFGNPVSNAEVWFNVTDGNGSLDTLNPVLTDINATAHTTFTLGPNPTTNIVTAEIVGNGTIRVTFLATGTSNKPEIISKIDNVEMLEDDPPYSIFLFASAIDDTDMPSDLRWYIMDYDTSFYSISGQGTNIIVITPEPNMFGNDLVNLMVVDSDGLSDSQPLWINITPVNDKPYFFPEPPDLTVTKDLPYTFNYAPYLIDIDNAMAELTITTDSASFTAVSGHLITYLYPSSMVNQQVYLTLTLDDGTESSQTVIQVNITEDNVPQLSKELPDVTLYEGEIKYNVFNLDDFFYDPDGDAVYFSYGYSRINIIINENHSVDFLAESDWNGEETVTFRARDPSSAISEDTIVVRVIPVNDPPTISGVPDLVVHYDSEYSFDLSPYIFDADNSTTELILTFMETTSNTWLISQYIDLDLDNNLKMIVNYPQTYLGTTFKVRIIVFDGIDFASQIINITVSSNWQPELKSELPDVVFYEDEYIFDEFDLNDYFTDRDGDALFFTYGHEHINVVINQNGSVDFSAEENWFGTENITIRATDSSGALVEDIITVSVLPVNDPPKIEQIPDQEGFVGVTWVLDLSSYIHDDDNNITQLEIYCESPYVTIVGSVLVFQYPKDIREDNVQLLIRDPNNANAQTAFNVTLKNPPQVGTESSDLFSFIWLFILIIAILVTLLLLYTYMRGKYDVEEALLVYRKKGILIAHVNEGQEEKMDRDLMTGMFTAIQDFVGDVFESEGQDTTQLKEMELGDKKVLIEHGEHTYIAAVFKGGATRLAPKLKSTLMELETEFVDVLEEWDGEIEALEGVDVYLERLVKN
jgi:parallel beta-helix repeat protein